MLKCELHIPQNQAHTISLVIFHAISSAHKSIPSRALASKIYQNTFKTIGAIKQLFPGFAKGQLFLILWRFHSLPYHIDHME